VFQNLYKFYSNLIYMLDVSWIGEILVSIETLFVWYHIGIHNAIDIEKKSIFKIMLHLLLSCVMSKKNICKH
jgi:hypothetical protein